jgi:hypothetical protein
VGVAVEAPLGVTVRGLVAGQVPDDQSLVARSGEEHVGAGRMSVLRILHISARSCIRTSPERWQGR